MPAVSFYTLGCKLNFAETSTLARAFRERAFDVVPFGQPADVVVINTCSVTDEADRKCRQVIRRALRSNADAFVAVTGCYAQLRPNEIAAIPGVSAVLGSAEKARLLDLLNVLEKPDATQIAVSCIDEVSDFGAAYSTEGRTRAFLKIQDGCDYSCSFCTIPMARGRSRSAPLEDTVARAHEIAERGYREIILSGVNIGLFGIDQGSSLLDLLRRLDDVNGIDRYRISSIEPNLLTDDIIDFVASSRRFQPHFHVPLQSGSDYVLGRMRRRYRREVFAGRVEAILHALPHAGIGADVIVGFPAESDDHFRETATFVADLPLAYLHVFTYSERPNTAVVDVPERFGGDPILPDVRAGRNRTLRLLSERKRATFYAAHVGSTRPVLWERTESDGGMHGYTDNYIRVYRPAESTLTGSIRQVMLGAPAKDGSLTVEELALPVL